MEANELKKVLAGFCIAGLIAGSSLTLGGCSTTGDRNGRDSGSSSSQTGCSGGSSCSGGSQDTRHDRPSGGG